MVVTNRQPPTTNHQPPTTNHQPLIPLITTAANHPPSTTTAAAAAATEHHHQPPTRATYQGDRLASSSRSCGSALVDGFFRTRIDRFFTLFHGFLTVVWRRIVCADRRPAQRGGRRAGGVDMRVDATKAEIGTGAGATARNECICRQCSGRSITSHRL